MNKHAGRGFTLVELLMVVAIIGIISMLAIPKLAGLKTETKERMNLANLERISSGIEAYVAAHADKDQVNFNKLDSLTVYSNHLAGTPGDTGRLGRKDNLLFYTNQVGNVGLSTVLFGNANPYTSNTESTLGEYCLSESDVEVLYRDLGIRFLYEGTDGVMQRVGDDNAWAQGDIADPDRCSSVCVSNYVGRPVAVVNPAATLNREPIGSVIYKAMGEDVAYTYTGKVMVDGKEMADNEAAFKALMVGGGILMAFGLGENCALVGNSEAGFDSAPVSPIMREDEYRRYLVLVRVKYAGGRSYTAKSAEFAGVMDPRGHVISALR